jgi:ABC-type nitrate/sulfonate/bicarbonate transport system substrate-binding protein
VLVFIAAFPACVIKVVPLAPPVTRQSLRSGEVASGMTDSSPDIDLVNDKANFEVVCDGAVAGTSGIDPYVVTKQFATENPAAAARVVEAAKRLRK